MSDCSDGPLCPPFLEFAQGKVQGPALLRVESSANLSKWVAEGEKEEEREGRKRGRRGEREERGDEITERRKGRIEMVTFKSRVSHV